MTLKDIVRRFQELLGPINRLPSWANELLSGFLCVGIAYGLLSLVGLRSFTFPLAFGLSELYEHLADPWGFNPLDVVERSRGIVLVMLVVALL